MNMKKMVEMDCCDVCGKPLYMSPAYIEGYAFKDAEGNKFDAVLCENRIISRIICLSFAFTVVKEVITPYGR